MPAEAAREAIFASCSEEVADWALERRGPQAVVPFTQPVELGGSTSRDPAAPAAPHARSGRHHGGVVELDTGHAPHLSVTTELARVLDRLAP